MALGGCHSFGMRVANTIRDSEAFGVGLGLTFGMALAGDMGDAVCLAGGLAGGIAGASVVWPVPALCASAPESIRGSEVPMLKER